MKRRETERIPNLVLLAMLIGSQQEAAGPPVIPPLPFTGCFLVGAQTSIWQRCMPHVVALCVCTVSLYLPATDVPVAGAPIQPCPPVSIILACK